jgi:hypothetical protein
MDRLSRVQAEYKQSDQIGPKSHHLGAYCDKMIQIIDTFFAESSIFVMSYSGRRCFIKVPNEG